MPAHRRGRAGGRELGPSGKGSRAPPRVRRAEKNETLAVLFSRRARTSPFSAAASRSDCLPWYEVSRVWFCGYRFKKQVLFFKS